jgi:multisubunit Na+/H+ antiporter MnhB subunit
LLGLVLGMALALGAVVLILATGGKDHTFRYTPPDLSTPEGLRVRLIMAVILAFILLVAYLLAFEGTTRVQAYILFVTFIVIAVFGTAGFRRGGSRHKDHKDKD